MPVETWDEATFAQFYRVADLGNGGVMVSGYTRRVLVDELKSRGYETLFSRRYAALAAAFAFQPGDRILVVGAGFGGLVEEFKDNGFINCWGVDNSPYIEANKGVEVRNDVVLISDDIRAGGRILNLLRQNTGDDEFDWIITEDVVSCYSDADLANLVPLMDTLLLPGVPLDHVIHYTTVYRGPGRMDSALNAKTIDDWNAVYPAHSWMAAGSFEVR